MRIVVVQPTSRARAPLPAVGVLRWYDPEPTLTVVVKATFSFAAPGPAVLAPRQLPLTLGEPAAGSDAEVAYPSDFVPRRGAADVVLKGHARASGGLSSVIEARLVAGEVTRRFQVISETPRGEITLLGPSIRGPRGERGTRVGAAQRPARPRCDGDHSPVTGPRFHDVTFNYFAYNTAPPEQLSDWIAADAAVELDGLCARGPVRFSLPGLAPRVLVDAMDEQVATLELVCDTLWLDVDRCLGVMVWRGHASVSAPEAPEVERIIVSLEPHREPLDEAELRCRAMRSRRSFASEEDRISSEPADDDERDQLIVTRDQLWAWAPAPPPELTLDEYASISAELAGGRAPRAETLARRELDEGTWTLEERGWLEKLAYAASKGDPSMAMEYSARLAAAQAQVGGSSR